MGSSMTYINGSNMDGDPNVVMTESESFGPDLLIFEALTSIKNNQELIMNYGDAFLIPEEDAGPVPQIKKRARIKRCGREHAPPAPGSLKTNPKAAHKRKRT